MKGFFRTMFLAGLVVLAVLCCGCGRESAGAWEAVDVAMGTMVRLKVYGPEEERAGEIFSQAREILQSLEEDVSPGDWRLRRSTGSMPPQATGRERRFRRRWPRCFRHVWNCMRSRKGPLM